MIFLSNSVIGIPNPSAVYCDKIGYTYKTDKTPERVYIVKPGVPANPTPFSLEQPDGLIIRVRQVGDERNAWIETLEGYAITQNLQGEWVYASEGKLSPSEAREITKSRKFKGLSGTNILRPSNRIVGKDLPKGLKKHIRPVLEDTRFRDFQSAQSEGGPSYSPGTTGTEYVVVIPIQFKSKSFSSGYDQAYYENLIFNESNPGSMNSYFKEVSYAQLNVTGIVTTIVTSINFMRYYGADGTPYTCGDIDGKNGCIYELAREAVQLIDPNINFSQYDKDSNGVVDHVIIIHAGDGQESSKLSDDIWSHAWYIDACSDPGASFCGEQVDGVEVEKYTMMAENSPVGTFAHEFGHDLGLPDLYNTITGTSVVGEWDLMDDGSWNGNPAGTSPAHLSAWGKEKLGWLALINVTEEIDVNISQIETNQEAYRLDDNQLFSLNEYFLVENRQLTGFDSYLPRSGILIWHIDDKQGSNSGTIKMVMPELAGGSLITAPFASNYGYTFFNSTSTPNTDTNSADETTVYAIDIGSSGSSMAATLFGRIIRLEPYIITGSKNVKEGRLFNFSSGVRCVNGYCGNVSATLNRYIPTLPTTCSEIWGGDCSEGPPESFDNTFDDCGTGAGGDESINEIYLDKSWVKFGEEIEVKCAFDAKALDPGYYYIPDDLYVYYRNSSAGQWKQKLAITSELYSDTNYLVSFVPDNIEGEHQVRCIAVYNEYNLSPSACANGSYNSYNNYYDNDDANFSVYNSQIPMNSGTPFYTINQNPMSCANMTNQSTCNQTWWVNATGEINTSWLLLSTYESDLPLIKTKETEKINITIIQFINNPPTAVALGPSTGIVNVPLQFDGSQSYDPDNDTLTYYWQFGDTNNSTIVKPIHTYSIQGMYPVNLTVTDYYGLYDDDSLTVNILPADSPQGGGVTLEVNVTS